MEDQFYTNRKDMFGLMALIAGILGIISTPTIFISFLFGIAAITFGALSRIHYEKFNNNSIVGIALGVVALFLSVVVLLSYKTLLQNPEFMAEYNRIMEEMMEIYSAQ